MLTSKEYVKKLKKECEPLFQFAENGVRKFFEKDPSKEELINYFVPRVVNERGNCTGIAARVANLPNDATPEEFWMLSKQVYDEAKHFRIGMDILTHINGEPVDVGEIVTRMKNRTKENGTMGPAQLMEKYESSTDPLAQALYSYIGEGRAARNWSMIAKTATDPLLAKKYDEIAKDERFHANIGRKKLEEICTTQEMQDKADELAREFMDDLYTIGLAKRLKNKPELADADGCVKSHYPLGAN